MVNDDKLPEQHLSEASVDGKMPRRILKRVICPTLFGCGAGNLFSSSYLCEDKLTETNLLDT